MAEHIVERLDLPNDLIRDVSGQVAYEEEAPRVKSIDAFSDNLGIKVASTSLVFNHLNSLSDHKVKVKVTRYYPAAASVVSICITTSIILGSNCTRHTCSYEWKGNLHVFFVYGFENKIYLPKYPQ
jgi:hypothetical protein